MMFTRLAMPTKVDLRPFCPPVQDQNVIGSCTAHALTSAVEILEAIDKLPQTMMSRLFVYYNERDIEGTIGIDSGASLRDGIKALASKGCCPEDDWPYDISKFTETPSDVAFADGLKHLITSYERITDLEGMKTCLLSGFPFVFGFSVYDSFESDAVAKTGIVPMPELGESCLGGHAVLACGMDDEKKHFIVRNSWSDSWGDKGYFYLSFDYLSNTNLADDFWTIRRGELL